MSKEKAFSLSIPFRTKTNDLMKMHVHVTHRQLNALLKMNEMLLTSPTQK